MKRVITYIILLMAAVAGRAESPQLSLQRAAALMSQAPSVQATFTMQTDEGTLDGTFTMAREQCRLKAGTITMWYDGTTQWVYSADTDEVNMTEPTAAELLETNPFSLLTGYESNFQLSVKGTNAVVLTPRKGVNTAVKTATVTFGADHWPVKFAVVFDNGTSMIVNIKKITQGRALPKSTFTFNPADYPTAEIIDLR